MSYTDRNKAPIVYLTYANVQGGKPTDAVQIAHLKHLNEEHHKVKNKLDSLKQERNILFYENHEATIDHIFEWLKPKERSKNLVLFGFSGHSDAGELMFEDQYANCQGLANYLINECPELKLVFLNGCLTHECHSYFSCNEEKKGVPIIISTNTQVGDKQAKIFAIEFFSQLGAKNTVDHAFNQAFNKIYTKKGSVKRNVIIRKRGLRKKKRKEKLDCYQIYYREEHFKNWKLSDYKKTELTKLFDLEKPKIDYDAFTCNRSKLWRNWIDFWNKQNNSQPFFVQFFLESDSVKHKPLSLVERFIKGHLMETYRDEKIKYSLIEANNMKLIKKIAISESPVSEINSLLQNTNQTNQIFLLCYDIVVQACSKKELKNWKNLIKGNWINDITGFRKNKHSVIIFHHIKTTPSTLKPWHIWKEIIPNHETRTKKIIQKTVKKYAPHTHIWNDKWDEIDQDMILQWAKKFSTRTDNVEKAVINRFGQFNTIPMHKVEGFLIDLMSGEISFIY